MGTWESWKRDLTQVGVWTLNSPVEAEAAQGEELGQLRRLSGGRPRHLVGAGAVRRRPPLLPSSELELSHPRRPWLVLAQQSPGRQVSKMGSNRMVTAQWADGSPKGIFNYSLHFILLAIHFFLTKIVTLMSQGFKCDLPSLPYICSHN